MKNLIVLLTLAAFAAGTSVFAGDACCATKGKTTATSAKSACAIKSGQACSEKAAAAKQLVRNGAKGATLLMHI